MKEFYPLKQKECEGIIPIEIRTNYTHCNKNCKIIILTETQRNKKALYPKGDRRMKEYEEF